MLQANPGGTGAGSQFRFGHVILALAPVLVTFLVQWAMWPFIRPHAWFLFSPAVFLSAWIGGRRVGILATVIATVLVAYFFVPLERTFVFERPAGEIASALTFLGTGVIFSVFHHRLKRVERGIAEAQATASENRLSAIFENAAVGITRVAPDGRFLEVNQRLCEMVGYPCEELLKKTFMEITHPDYVEADLNELRRMLAGETEVYLREKRYFRKDGSLIWASLAVSLVRHADGSPDYFVAVIEDISARKHAEEKLLQSEQRLRLALGAAGLGVFEWNIPADRAVWENERMFDLFGHTNADGTLSKEKLTADYMYPDDIATFEQALADGMKSGHPVHTIYRIRRKDGAMRWLDLSSSFELAQDGSPLRMIGVLADITERQLAEEKLRASELRFRTMVSAIPSPTYEGESEGNNTFVSDQWCTYTGMTAVESAGRGFIATFHPDDADDNKARYLAAVQSGKLFESRLRLRAADGSYRWFLNRALPGRDAEGRIVRWAGSLTDIDDLVRAQEALHESESRFRQLAESLPQLVWTCNADGRCDYVSPQFVDYTGIPAAEQLGFDWLNQIYPGDREPLMTAWNRTLSAGEPFDVEYRIRRNDGQYRWFKTRAVALRDSGNKVVKWFGTNTDIDDQKRVDQALRESRERLAGIVSTTMDAIITVDEDHRIVLFNEAAERMFGCPAAEALGLPLDRFIPERFRGAHPEHIRAFGETGGTSRTMGKVQELRALRADATEFPIEASISKIEIGGRKLFTVIHRDITERKQAEAEREQLAREQTARAEAERAAERIRRLQAVTDSALVHLTLDDLFHEMLARIRELLETDSAAILLLTEDKRSLVIRAAIGFEEEAVGLHNPVGEGVAGSIASSLAPLIVEDLSTTDVIDPVLRQNGHSMIGAPLIVKGECIGVIHADTSQPRRFAESDLRLLQLAADRIALAIELRHLYEVQQQARHQAEEANRMKDEFLAVVSHELRSPLTAILGYTHMLRSGPADRETINHATAVVERSAKAQLQIIEDLLDSARIITGKLRIDLEPVDLVPVLEAALDTVRAAAESKGITLVANFGWAPEETLGDSTRLQQVVWNLLSNAIKFTPKGGLVELRMAGAADHVRIDVSDTGKGIEPEFLPFVFDRFRQADSSSARRFGGLGLGLSLVKHLVELHGGTIVVASQGVGHGSNFTVTLPRRQLEFLGPTPAVAPREVRTDDALVVKEALSLEGVSVLIVDDQEDARVLLIHALDEYGAKTTAVSSGAEALAFLSNPPGGRWPDVMILDIAMPDEDGYCVLKKVRALEAEQGFGTNQIPAIALTAFARSEDRLRALQAGFHMHVTKPVEPAELALTIASLTNRRIWERRRKKSS
jgi:PAS domain S-box-containing protein